MYQETARKALRILGLFALMLALVNIQSSAQGDKGRPAITFSPHEQNPVLMRTAGENWGCEDGTIFAPKVLQHQGRYYLFYTGSCNRQGRPAAIGYAVSEDGVTWSKYTRNPILAPDGEGYDAMCVSVGVPLMEGDLWVLYYAGNSQPCAGPGRYIGRATASSPDGTWVRAEVPMLAAGKAGDWDEGFIMPHAVLRTEQGYVMYYSGGSEYLLPLPRLIGMATSPDGIHWAKYNDPATSQPPYASSDPVLELQEDGTTAVFSAWAVDVLKTEDGWEMFYSGTCPAEVKQDCPGFIAYATSADGIRWTTYRTPETLVLTPKHGDQEWAEHCVCYPSVLRTDVDASYKLYYTGCTDQPNDCQIGLATGTITWH